jgi:hypothetical protein
MGKVSIDIKAISFSMGTPINLSEQKDGNYPITIEAFVSKAGKAMTRCSVEGMVGSLYLGYGNVLKMFGSNMPNGVLTYKSTKSTVSIQTEQQLIAATKDENAKDMEFNEDALGDVQLVIAGKVATLKCKTTK